MPARHHLPVFAPSSLRADGSRAFVSGFVSQPCLGPAVAP